MYRSSDPRFRRRLNELGQTLESANESAQSGLYIFGHSYVKPCFDSVIAAATTCVDASCPSLNLAQSEQARRQRGRARGRAELNFDFYDDWDDEEEGLLGWGDDEFDRLVGGEGQAGYGTVGTGDVTTVQPARQRGMSYPKGGRGRGGSALDGGQEQGGISALLARLFGGRGGAEYKPSAANLQEHPGARHRDRTEGEALLDDSEFSDGRRTKQKRIRSNTVGSGHTTDSLSSRGDIFPSDGEDDAVPLDDEFAMVLERRNTNTLSGPETDNSSGKTRSDSRKRGKRPSGSRTTTRRTTSSRSARSSLGHASNASRRSSTVAFLEETEAEAENKDVPTLDELKREEQALEHKEETEIERKRAEAQRIASERGLLDENPDSVSSKEATPRNPSLLPPVSSDLSNPPSNEPSQLPTPVATDDEDEAIQLQEQPLQPEQDDSKPCKDS
ncbi:Hypothetical protein R9X50_00670100 [Acrodontium crateriforme]|uniref:Uncharacterized protein n=1 Tax=Acrodontium crateriforme TaxID=150365 RepID=A0AAQ3MBE0_9PEZI|nr:Hypothetical protein R9X50_00670100 [Acrodontium crateriforme]